MACIPSWEFQKLKIFTVTLQNSLAMQVDSYYQIVWQNLVFSNISFTIGFQKWIGYGDVKSLPVYFYVQRSSVFNATNTPITFDTARLNNGGAMNLTSGIFTAPRTGTYFFSFIAIAVFPTSSSVIQGATVALHLNGNPIGYGEAEDVNTTYGQNDQLALHSTLYLQAGDKAWIQIDGLQGSGVHLYNDLRRFTHFNGWLLEEDISQSL